MKVTIKAIPNAKKNFIKEENGVLKVYISAPAVDGKANKAVCEILAEHFSVRRSRITILKGETSRDKVIEIAAI